MWDGSQPGMERVNEHKRGGQEARNLAFSTGSWMSAHLAPPNNKKSSNGVTTVAHNGNFQAENRFPPGRTRRACQKLQNGRFSQSSLKLRSPRTEANRPNNLVFYSLRCGQNPGPIKLGYDERTTNAICGCGINAKVFWWD